MTENATGYARCGRTRRQAHLLRNGRVLDRRWLTICARVRRDWKGTQWDSLPSFRKSTKIKQQQKSKKKKKHFRLVGFRFLI